MDTQEEYRATSNRKCFKTTFCGDPLIMRTGCLILRKVSQPTQDFDFIMIKEAYTDSTLSFPGGTCETEDRDIYDTVTREFYEECVLGDTMDDDYLQNWSTMLQEFLNNPTDRIHHIIKYIYSCIKSPDVDIFAYGEKLKCLYFQVFLDDSDFDYLTNNHDVHQINISDLRSGFEDNIICLPYGEFILRHREKQAIYAGLHKFLRTCISCMGSIFHDMHPKTVCKKIIDMKSHRRFHQSVKDRTKHLTLPKETIYLLLHCTWFLPIIYGGNKDHIQLIWDYYYKFNIDFGLDVFELTYNIIENKRTILFASNYPKFDIELFQKITEAFSRIFKQSNQHR